jgi:hypothetical protein
MFNWAPIGISALILFLGAVATYFIYKYCLYYRRYTFDNYDTVFSEDLTVQLNDAESGKPSGDYLPPLIDEHYAPPNSANSNSVNNREKRTRSQSSIWKKEKEDARKTLEKMELDENKFKAESEKINISNKKEDEELINLRFEELQRQSLSLVGTPTSNTDSSEIIFGETTTDNDTPASTISTTTPTTKLNRLMGDNINSAVRTKTELNSNVQDVSTPTTKLNKLMDNDGNDNNNVDDSTRRKSILNTANTSTPTTRLSFLYGDDGSNIDDDNVNNEKNNVTNTEQEVSPTSNVNNNQDDNNNQQKKKRKKKKKKKK